MEELLLGRRIWMNLVWEVPLKALLFRLVAFGLSLLQQISFHFNVVSYTVFNLIEKIRTTALKNGKCLIKKKEKEEKELNMGHHC